MQSGLAHLVFLHALEGTPEHAGEKENKLRATLIDLGIFRGNADFTTKTERPEKVQGEGAAARHRILRQSCFVNREKSTRTV